MYQRREDEDTPSIYELAIQHKDGSRVEVEFSAGLTIYEGSPAVLVIVRDITARVQAEQELQASQRLLSLVIDNLPALVAYVDRVQALPVRQPGISRRPHGKPRSAFIGKHIKEILGPEGYAATIPPVAKVLAGEALSFEGLFNYPR